MVDSEIYDYIAQCFYSFELDYQFLKSNLMIYVIFYKKKKEDLNKPVVNRPSDVSLSVAIGVSMRKFCRTLEDQLYIT